jgi:serine/threonine protein kinase
MMPFGRYSVQVQVGIGGMGTVYRGTQLSLGRPVAIKILRVGDGCDFAFEDRFRREARAMATLNHPNIVSIYDYGHLGSEFLFFVMEFVDGTDLGEIMSKGRMTLELALQLLPQICAGLEYAHSKGIIHRDIKPANIMLTREGEVKITDFGLAKDIMRAASMVTETRMVMGTPEYAAPEQFNAHRDVDHRADVYALGVLMYQMLTGVLPRGSWQPPSTLQPRSAPGRCHCPRPDARPAAALSIRRRHAPRH